MDKENQRSEIVRQIRRLAGELGAIEDELENVADAENYDFQVQTGLAAAVTEILEDNPFSAIRWFGYCLISCGVEADPRIICLLDSLDREVDSQLATEEDGEES
jgi:hypothetical protein